MNETNVKMKPVCETCSHVIDGLILKSIPKDHNKFELNYIFEPSFCPNCKSKIKGISIPEIQGYIDGVMHFE